MIFLPRLDSRMGLHFDVAHFGLNCCIIYLAHTGAVLGFYFKFIELFTQQKNMAKICIEIKKSHFAGFF